MPLVKQKSLLAAKIETTSGTAESLTSAEAAYNVFDLVMNASITVTERMGNGSFSSLTGITEARAATCTFRTEIYGDGAGGVPAWADVFFPACGWVKAGAVFSPASGTPGTSIKTLTLAHYVDGYRKVMRGCAGSFKIVCETGKLAHIEWTFSGVYVDLEAAALLTPTYPTRAPIRVANAPFTLGSWTPCFARFEADAGNNVMLRPCQTAADGSGLAAAHITGRKVVCNFDPEMTLPGTFAPWTDWIDHTERALSLELQDADDSITIAAPKAQVLNAQEADRNGIVTANIQLGCNRSASAGDDELTITFAAA